MTLPRPRHALTALTLTLTLTGCEHMDAGRWRLTTQWHPDACWTQWDRDLDAREGPRVTFSRKFQTNSLKRDPKETYLFGAFEVHILPPGKYLLTGGDD